MIGFNRNAWSDSAETGGRIQPKRVIAFTRNPQLRDRLEGRGAIVVVVSTVNQRHFRALMIGTFGRYNPDALTSER